MSFNFPALVYIYVTPAVDSTRARVAIGAFACGDFRWMMPSTSFGESSTQGRGLSCVFRELEVCRLQLMVLSFCSFCLRSIMLDHVTAVESVKRTSILEQEHYVCDTIGSLERVSSSSLYFSSLSSDPSLFSSLPLFSLVFDLSLTLWCTFLQLITAANGFL